jgi:hypothetical protein
VWADAYSTLILGEPAIKHYYRLDQTSGTNATDSGASPINGTYTGGFTLNQTGIPGTPTDGSVAFNGSTGYVALTNNTDFNWPTGSGNGMTVEAWINPTTTAATQAVAGMYTGAVEVWQLLGNSLGAFQFKIYPKSGTCAGGTYGIINNVGSYGANAWTYVVATTTGAVGGLTNMKLYVNATLISTNTSFTGSICDLNEVANLGRLQDGIFFLNGREDEVAIYRNNDGTGNTGALSQAQITSHYNLGAAISNGGLNSYSVKAWDTQLPKFPRGDLWAKFIQDPAYQTGGFRAVRNRSVLSPTPVAFGLQFPLRNYLGR